MSKKVSLTLHSEGQTAVSIERILHTVEIHYWISWKSLQRQLAACWKGNRLSPKANCAVWPTYGR